MARIAKIVEPKMTLVTVTTVPHNIYMMNAGGGERRPGFINRHSRIPWWRRVVVRVLGVTLAFLLLWAFNSLRTWDAVMA